MAIEASTDTNAAEDLSVDLAGLVDALGISAEDASRFTPEGESNTTETKTVDGSVVDPDAVTSSSTEAETEETTKELEPTQPEGIEVPKVEEVKEDGEGQGWPASAQERVNKLTGKNYALTEQVEQLTSQLAEAKKAVPQGTPQVVSADIPLGDVQNHGDLFKVKEQALEAKEWALMNPNGGSYELTRDGKTETKEFSADEVRDVLVKANRLLDRDIPARKDYLDAAGVHFQAARTAYPTLFDQNHPDSKLANQFLNAAPWVKKFSDYPLIVGDYLSGARARLVKEAAAGKPGDVKPGQMAVTGGKAQPAANKAKVIGSPKGQAGPKTRSVVNISELAKSGKSDLSVDDAANILDSFFGD